MDIQSVSDGDRMSSRSAQKSTRSNLSKNADEVDDFIEVQVHFVSDINLSKRIQRIFKNKYTGMLCCKMLIQFIKP